MQGCPSHAARIAPRRGPLRLARPPARRADSTARRRNRCYKSDATATEWRGQQQGCLARFQGCLAGSPALPPRQPCTDSGLPARQPCAGSMAALRTAAGSPAGLSRQPCARFPAALRGSSATARQPCAAALRGSPARQQDCLAGSPARHRQPCAAAPGVACFARFGAGRVPRPFTLRTLKTVTARKARLPCADAGLPCTAAPAARRAPAARCAPVTAQPCAGSPAALRWQQGSPARQQGCWAGSAAPPDLRQPWAVSRLPCGRPPAAAHHSLSEKQSCAAQISRSPGAFCAGFFYKRRDRHSPEPPERPAGAPGRPGARGRLSAPHTYEATVPSSRQTAPPAAAHAARTCRPRAPTRSSASRSRRCWRCRPAPEQR